MLTTKSSFYSNVIIIACTEICNFSGFKIYPGKGRLFVRSDSRVFRFINGKSESYFLQRLKPSKFDWTVVFRRLHKKGISEESSKKRTRRTVKVQRAVVGASLEAIKAKRDQNPIARAAERKKAVDAIKDKKREEQAKKAKAARPAQNQPKFSKQQAKGSAPKVAAKSLNVANISNKRPAIRHIISFTGHLAPRLDSPLDIRLHGQLVSRVESYKYLGVLIDSKLDHSACLKQKRSALEHTISALHPVLANHRLTVNYRSRIFSAVVMGKAYYGLELVGGNKSHLAPLQTTINKGIRLFTGARLSTAIGPLLVETGIGSLLTRSLVSRVRLLERSVTKRTPINAICSGTDNDVFTLNVQGQLVRSQRWFWSRRTKQLYRNRYWLTPQVRPKTVKQRHSFALMETLQHVETLHRSKINGHRIQSGLVPAIQKSRLRLLGRALDPGVENVYTWLRGGVLNGEADLDQQWLDGTVEHESMGTRHDNRALAARLADFPAGSVPAVSIHIVEIPPGLPCGSWLTDL
ncbi:hypothetical protein BASA60_006566 [Batrachochytrium salamandrivorans]|nr:hypothetical protein BASA60_006566 [Batrachochytrium salamandrivorans]